VWQVTATAGYLLQVTLASDAGSLEGSVYDMDISSVLVGVCPVDMFEPNDAVPMATWLPSQGFYPAMQVCIDEPDYFSFAVLAGEQLEVWLDYDPAEADLDLELWDPGGALYDVGTGAAVPAWVGATGVAGGLWTVGAVMVTELGADGVDYDLTLVVAPP
jgi:hypothetical protein